MKRDRLRRSSWTLVGALALILSTTAALGQAEPSPAAATDQAPTRPFEPAGAEELTLITGDRVTIHRSSSGRQAITVSPAKRSEGYEPSFESYDYGGQLYVIPSDAAALVPDVLDRELFNVTRLATFDSSATPVIATYRDRAAARRADDATGMRVTDALPSIGGVAATVDPSGRWWRDHRDATTTHTPASGRLGGIEKVWLDRRVHATLDESVPLVGAPTAWEQGYDGSGVTVAVLDTGVDADHPDLAGHVVAEANFSDSDTTDDRYGHGTHVAGIIAGTGAASDGQYTGVAPGAEVMNGKVLDDAGRGSTSDVIAGMEWAAANGADIANLSLGCGPSDGCTDNDGTDPLSLAVDRLTESTGTLFVIAAGNDGPAEQSVGLPGVATAALTVGSVSKTERLARTSGRGPRVGDYAIKPDVTAPGVDIVAARAYGTSLGTPQGEHYTELSGTSMATPHVAGAAAILLQRNPDQVPADVKARLATTAVPHDDLTVYEQGGGRIDIPNALAAPVHAAPTPLDLGYFPYPSNDTGPTTAEVTYTNTTDEPITLGLSLDVANEDGVPASDSMLSVSPTTLSLSPGEAAPATVTLDVTVGEFGLYGGYLLASADGQPVTRTPIGFYKEPELYELTVTGIARDGRPAAGSSSLGIVDVHDATAFADLGVRYDSGVATVMVPPGTYSVMGIINTYGGSGRHVQNKTMVGDPEVEITEDTAIVLDARDANPIEIATPSHDGTAPRGHMTVGYWRGAESGGDLQYLTTGPAYPLFAAPTDSVTVGGFELVTRTRFGEPRLALGVVDPVERSLRVDLMSGSPIVDGEVTLPLVYAGTGLPGDYEGVDVTGAIVLVRRGGLSFAEQEANAAAAGADALVIANDQSGLFPGYVGDGAVIPTMSTSKEDGDRLLELLDAGEVTLRLEGHRVTSYLYDLVLAHPGRIPADLSYVADTDELATLDNAFHGDVAGLEFPEVRHFWRPWQSRSFLISDDAVAGHARTEYLVAGDTRYQQHVRGLLMLEPITSYESGEYRDQTLWKQPARPGVVEGEPVHRDGDTLHLAMAEWVDAHRGHYGYYDSDLYTSAFRLYEDGELTAVAERPRGDFPMGPDPAAYRLELDVTRDTDWSTTSTRTRTTWTLSSARPPAGRTAVVPLLLVDYDVELDLLNRMIRPDDGRRPPGFVLRVRHQPGAEAVPIASARVWMSYDDGDTWRTYPTRRLGDGRYRAILPVRHQGEFASIRVDARDADGNRIEQEIIRAWKLQHR